MKSQVFHTVWCNTSGDEAAEEIWDLSLLASLCRYPAQQAARGKTFIYATFIPRSAQWKFLQASYKLRASESIQGPFPTVYNCIIVLATHRRLHKLKRLKTLLTNYTESIDQCLEWCIMEQCDMWLWELSKLRFNGCKCYQSGGTHL